MLLNRILRDKGTPVYTIHAEVKAALISIILWISSNAQLRKGDILPFKRTVIRDVAARTSCRGNIAGREGWLGCQQIAGSRDEIGTLPYRPLRVYCLLLPVPISTRLLWQPDETRYAEISEKCWHPATGLCPIC